MEPESDGPPTEEVRGHTLFMWGIAALAAFVLLTAWVGPGGCQSGRSQDGSAWPARPPSPLDEVVDRRREAASDETPPPTVAEAPAPRPLPPAAEPQVRVRFATVRGGEVDLAAPSSTFEIRELDGTTAPATMASPISVRSSGASWVVRGAGGAEWSAPAARPLEIRARNGSGAETPVTFAGSRWPGVLRLHQRSDGGGVIDLVAVLGMERYLPGVLAKELYRSWDLETYRAQAIAARSYAVCEADYWGSRRHFDLVAGEASQAWIGESTSEVARRATADTRGVLLLYDGRVVPAYYSSCCGGAAADAVDAVTRNPLQDIPPLALGRSAAGRRPDCCRNSPSYSWTERLAADEVGRRLAAWGRANGRPDLAQFRAVAAVETPRWTVSGRAAEFRVMDETGASATVSAEAFRTAMNSADGRDSSEPARRLRSSNFEATVTGGWVTFEGHGHGHGVGLCQYGSEAMARAGRSWRQILARYYPGAEPSRCW